MICCGPAAAVGRSVFLVEIFRVDVAIKPFGHVGDREDAEMARGIIGGLERGVVENDSVVLVGKKLVVVLAFEGVFIGIELFCSATEENVGTIPP